jgi:mannose-6-phosphate isomerase-like protein (cupin superfamily)
MEEKKIIDKPWGKEEILCETDKYVVKFLDVRKGHRLSKQFHNEKLESLFIIFGVAKVELDDEIILTSNKMAGKIGRPITIEPGKEHRIEAITTCRFLEVSTPELTDVVRIEDDYNRNGIGNE